MLYTIHFACTKPGEPGCGCPDNDFYAEHSFAGTYEEAEAEAMRINHQQYYGDFTWWITPDKPADEPKSGEMVTKKKKIVILSGPSCVGKGPLKNALKRYHPEIKYSEPVLLTSRRPRLKAATGKYEVHGVDYYFMPESIISNLNPKDYIVAKVRTEAQAVDMKQMETLFEKNDLIIAEVYCTLGRKLMEWVRTNTANTFEIISVSLMPLSFDEIEEEQIRTGKNQLDIVYELMKEKLKKRAEDEPEKKEQRAKSAWPEIQYASCYTKIIVNHAGEDDTIEWGDPLGKEASRVLEEFIEVLKS